jgi:primosomal protein N' (replication factor Y)
MAAPRRADIHSTMAMRARVVIVGAAGGVEQLTYAIPPALAGRVACGHRVLVPLRSRRMTGLVTEVGADLESGGVEPREIIELLEAEPLFDRAHIRLIEFLSAYYLASLADAYRAVMPAAARVETGRAYQLGARPNSLQLAALSPLERSLLDALAVRPCSSRQLARCGARRDVESALARLVEEGLVAVRDATRGRHRRSTSLVVRRAAHDAASLVRGARQREILERLDRAGADGIDLAALAAEMPAAREVVRSLAGRGLVELAPAVRSGDAADGGQIPYEPAPDQSAAIAAVTPAVRDRRFETFLLWGVTASGKTEVYLRLAAEALAQDRRVLVMVPEIALADQIVSSFRARFGAQVGVAHSAQNIAERWASWSAALAGDCRVMIGPRSAVFAPMRDLGLIVVDEEHDPAYKNEEGIRYHARDLAVALGRFSECPVILGSATPSAESFVNARRGRYRMLRMPRRIGDRALAEVEIIDLRGHLRAGDRDHPDQPRGEPPPPDAVPLSPPLIDAMRANLAAGGQSVIFLNRRGYHNFLQCHLCGNVIACGNCSVSLTFHLRDRSLRCHYCGASAAAPDRCPECGGYGLAGQGFGTERLTQALAEILPDARIERMDSDTSGRRGVRGAILGRLARGELDVLVGTQMIAKGFDFPGVTLVGVVMADLTLNLPDYRSAERTFQLLTQVAGRAGRGARPGRVLIQTYAPHHYSIRAARDQDYARFIRRELELRRDLMYPPFARLALVRIEGMDAGRAGAIATAAASALARDAKPDAMRVLGPAPAPIERIKGRYRFQVMLKAIELKHLRDALAAMRAQIAPRAARDRVRLAIDIDPVNML